MAGARFRGVAILLACAALASCADDPDLVARGASPLAGTGAADYLGGHPFAISADGRYLFYALARADVSEAGALGALEPYRLMTLPDGRPVQIDPPPSQLIRQLSRDPLPPVGGCWTLQPPWRLVLGFSRRRAPLLVPGGDGAAAWVLQDAPLPQVVPDCLARLPPTGDLTFGDFAVQRGNGRLRVTHGVQELIDLSPGWLRSDVLLGDAVLSPDGARLALVYSEASGSFVGRSRALLLDPRTEDGVRELGGGVLKVGWDPGGDALYGYARAEGERSYAIYRWER